MGRIVLAFRAFWAALLNAAAAQRLQAALNQATLPKVNEAEKPPPATPPAKALPARSEAVTLLAALQRDARFVDLVKQPLADFSDEEIGAAARNVLGDCSAVIDRFFRVEPLSTSAEGAKLTVPSGYDPGTYKLSGRVENAGPFSGTVVHHGWKATSLNLPTWTGSSAAALVIAPVEVEIA